MTQHSTPASSTDVVIVGGGHNGLVAAAYLAQAGKSVTLLERLDHVGGAAVSAQAFDGVDARLSRYSYLVSLLPERIIHELKLDIDLKRRRYSSYTPKPGTEHGLLVDNADAAATAESFASIGAAGRRRGLDRASTRARPSSPGPSSPPSASRCSPAPRRSAPSATTRCGTSIIERPIGETIEATFSDDLVRGVVLTDALIGTFVSRPRRVPRRQPLLPVPRDRRRHRGLGRAGRRHGRRHRRAGARRARRRRDAGHGCRASCRVSPDGEVRYVHDGDRARHRRRHGARECRAVRARSLLAAPRRPLEVARRRARRAARSRIRPEGAQVKVNLMLLPASAPARHDRRPGGRVRRHLPHQRGLRPARDGVRRPRAAGRCRTRCRARSTATRSPTPRSSRPSCRPAGAQTLTVFGLHAPDRLLTPENNDEMREVFQRGRARLAQLGAGRADRERR